MSQRGYAIAFMIVLLFTCTAAFFGGRFLWQRMQTDIGSNTAWAPPDLTTPAATAGAATAAAADTETPAPATPSEPNDTLLAAARATALAAGKPSATRVVIPTPKPGLIDLPTLVPDTPRPGSTLYAETPLPEGTIVPSDVPLLIETPTPHTDTPEPSDYPFVLVGAVKNYAGSDCPGNYVVGTVIDRAGNPLPNVRLRLVDEYGNADTKVSKSESVVAGQYDFPVNTIPRHLYLTVVDDANRPLSMQVTIPHRLGADAQDGCHRVNWQRR